MIFPLPHHLKKYVSTSPPSIAPLHLFLLFSWSNIGLFLFPDLHTFNQHIRFTPNLKIYLMNPLPIKISVPILSPLVTAKMQERESCAPKLAVPLFYFLLFLKPFYNVSETIDCRLPAWTHYWVKITKDGASKSALTNPPGNSYKLLHLEKL